MRRIDRPAWAWLLLAHRLANGLTQQQLAGWLHTRARRAQLDHLPDIRSLRRHVQRWETGDVDPGGQYRAWLAERYHTTETELFGSTITAEVWRTLLTTAVSVAERTGMDQTRRQFLMRLLVTAAAAAGTPPAVLRDDAGADRLAWALAHPDHVDQATVAMLHQRTRALRDQHRMLASVTLLGPARDHLQVVTTLLDAGPHPDPISVGLRSVHAQLATITAWLAYDARDLTTAAHNAAQATTTAATLPDGWPYAYALIRRAMMHAQRATPDHGRARQLLQTAAQRPSTSHATTAWLTAALAELDALDGHRDTTLRQLDHAQHHVDQITGSDPAGDLFDQARLDGYAASCALWLGDQTAAEPRLRAALDAFSAAPHREQAVLLADLAAVHALHGDPRGACEHLHAALGVATQTRGTVALRRILWVRDRLEPHRTMACLAGLDRHLRTALIA